MKNNAFIKTSVCLAAATVVLLTSNVPKSQAAMLSLETTGIAGISLSFDKYYNTFQGMAPVTIGEDNIISILSKNNENTDNNNTDTVDVVNADANPLSRSLPTVDEQNDTPAAEEASNAEAEEEKEMPEPVSEYEHTGISVAEGYVRIRKKPNTDSEIMGKLYRGSAATITATKGDWVKIKSGSVTGYIKSEFLAIGFDAEDLVDQYGTKLATVNTTTLFVREEKSTDSRILTMIPLGETYEVKKEYDEWVKISIDGEEEEDHITGYISKEYVDIHVEFEEAISIQEELDQIAREEAAREAEAEQARKLAEEQERLANQNKPQTNNSSSSSSSSSNSSSSSSSKPSTSNSNKPSTSNNSNSTPSKVAEAPSSGSGGGAEVASFARKFVGNPYVYGGTSLTNGADCSGFVMSVYKSFGYSIPRDSRSQAAGAGKEVSLGSLKAGDLVFYTGSSGSVNHVALYIGGGQVVHASTKRTGIKISQVNYRTPYKARRVIN